MSDADALDDIKNDLNFLKEKISRMEITINEIDGDMHRKFNPRYAKKLENIEKKDKRIHFKYMGEFDKHFEQ